MNLKEIAVGGVWAASAVGVAGWTWQSYTQQYAKFPGPGDPGGASPFDWEGLLLGHGIVRKAIDAVTGAIGGAFAPLPKRPIPPRSTGKSTTPGAIVPPKGVRPHPGR